MDQGWGIPKSIIRKSKTKNSTALELLIEAIDPCSIYNTTQDQSMGFISAFAYLIKIKVPPVTISSPRDGIPVPGGLSRSPDAPVLMGPTLRGLRILAPYPGDRPASDLHRILGASFVEASRSATIYYKNRIIVFKMDAKA